MYLRDYIKIIIVLAFASCFLTGCTITEKLPAIQECGENAEKIELVSNQFDNLCVPTQMIRHGEDYFVVDCYHNQILTAKSPDISISDWNVLTDKIVMGHTIASDGVVYLCDDTENNRVLVYAKEDDDFYYLKELEGIGKRPHFITYYDKNDTFYALSSLTGEFYLFKREKGSYNVFLEKCVQIPQLDNVYVRSFTFIDDLIYLPAGNGFIYEIDPESFEIISFQALPAELGGPTQITRIGNYYYLTVSTNRDVDPSYANIVRAKSTDDFIDGKYESLKHHFCDDGTPYVITKVDDKYYLAWHSDDGKNCMWSFTVDQNDNIAEINRVFE